MATLQEIEDRFLETRKKIKSIKDDLYGINSKIDKIDKKIEAIRKQKENLILEESSLSNNDSKKVELQSKIKELTATQNDLESEKKQLEEKKSKVDNVRLSDELRVLESEMIGIIKELSSDPNINKYLQQRLNLEYDNKIAKKEDEKVKTQEQYDKFNQFLTKELKKEVDSLVIAYSNVKKTSFYTDSKKISQKESANTKYFLAAQKLREAIKSNPEFGSIEITDKDLEAIISGKQNGRYILPTFENKIKRIEKSKTNFEQKKQEILNKIKGFKKIDTTTSVELLNKEQEISNKENEITQKESQIIAKDDQITQVEQEIQTIDTELNNIALDENRLTELESKMPSDLEQRINDANNELNLIVSRIKAKGFISEEVFTELNDENSQMYKKFIEFMNADKDVRIAFFNCKGEVSQTTKDELIQKIQEYTRIANELSLISGMDVKSWNKFLLRKLEQKSRGGQNIDQVYFKETIDSRYESIENAYSEIKTSDEVKDKYDQLGKSLERIAKDQERVLTGENYDINSILLNVDDYEQNMNNLANSLGIEVKELFSRMKNNLVEKSKGIFARIKNFITNKFSRNKKFKANVQYEEGTYDLENKLILAREKCERLAEERTGALDETLTPDEKNELDDLKSKKERKNELMHQKSAKEAHKSNLYDERDILSNEKNNLESQRSTLEAEKDSILASSNIEQIAGSSSVSSSKHAKTISRDVISVMRKSKDKQDDELSL